MKYIEYDSDNKLIIKEEIKEIIESIIINEFTNVNNFKDFITVMDITYYIKDVDDIEKEKLRRYIKKEYTGDDNFWIYRKEFVDNLNNKMKIKKRNEIIFKIKNKMVKNDISE